jgi:YCII-related domain
LTLYWKNGKVATTDGPYTETKEQLGGIQILEARDLNHAVQLVSQLPGFKYGLGPVEIRPVVELSEIIKESEQRRRRKEVAMRADTRERIISIMARGWPGGNPVFSWPGQTAAGARTASRHQLSGGKKLHEPRLNRRRKTDHIRLIEGHAGIYGAR